MLIEKLIEDELLRFTTLDETNEPVALSPELNYLEQQHGAEPLDGSSFEDPRQWAGELLGDDGSVQQAPVVMVDPQPTPASPVPDHPGLEPGELAGALESDSHHGDRPMPDAAPPKQGSKALKVVLAVLLIALLGVGAAIALLLLNP